MAVWRDGTKIAVPGLTWGALKGKLEEKRKKGGREPIWKKMKAKEKMRERTDIRLKSSCPMCTKTFDTAWSTRRHLESAHFVENLISTQVLK